MAIILGADVETTGLCFEKDRCTEIGLVLWDTDTNQPVDLLNQLVNANPRPVVSPEITRLTGITEPMLLERGCEEAQAYELFAPWWEEVDYVVAHNAPFDRGMLYAMFQRIGAPESTLQKKWIDTCVDVPYPDEIDTRKLQFLAPLHGFLNPFSHRAVFDVLSMLRILAQYDFAQVAELSHQPNIRVKALCRPPWEDGGKETGEAKGRGFRYDGSSKSWTKVIKEGQLAKEQAALSFKLVNLGVENVGNAQTGQTT